MSDGRPESVSELLKIHYRYINRLVESTGSELLKIEFNNHWENVNYGTLYASIGERLSFAPDSIISEIKNWISNMEVLRDSELNRYKEMEKTVFSDWIEMRRIAADINSIIASYYKLINAVEEIDLKFANKTLAYKSPLRKALQDITLLYNKINNIQGDFSFFRNVSLYIHGIESDGKDFLASAVEAAEPGEIIVHVDRDKGERYYMVTRRDGKNDMREVSYGIVRESNVFDDQRRLHLIYDTEHKNEHRQETSDDLTQQLMNMGLMKENIKFDLYAHSYGGRRSFQFAVDHPEHVRSVTTIGTPYETNVLGSFANNLSWLASLVVSPTEYSEYQSFHPEDQRVDDGIVHSNVYSDMDNLTILDLVNDVEAANPEVYEKLKDMDIAAIGGYTRGIYISDTVVSLKSQLGIELHEIIDERIIYKVNGIIGHLNEVRDEKFVEYIRENNEKQKE